MIHHAIRCLVCCFVDLPAATSNSRNRQPRPPNAEAARAEQAQRDAIIYREHYPHVPKFLLHMKAANRDSFVLLYIFVTAHHRLPFTNEPFCRNRLGEWTVKLRHWQLDKKLSPEQVAALRLIPFWPQDGDTAAARTAADITKGSAAAAVVVAQPRPEVAPSAPLLKAGAAPQTQYGSTTVQPAEAQQQPPPPPYQE